MQVFLKRKSGVVVMVSIGIALIAAILIFMIITIQHPSLATNTSGTIQPSSQELIDSKLGVANPNQGTVPIVGSQPPANVASAAKGCVLVLSIAPTMRSIASGGSYSYAVTIKNSGTIACQNTSYSFYYGDNESYVSAAPRPTASNYYWRVGMLASGATYTASISMIHNPTDESSIQDEACATADNVVADSCADTTIAIGTAVSAPVINPPVTTPSTSPAPVSSDATSYTAPSGMEFGVWVWDTPLQMSHAQVDSMLTSVKSSGMNAIYITVDDYVPIAALPAGAQKSAQTQNYFTALHYIISQAKTMGIAVDAEGGARDWALPQNQWKGFALIDFVQAYNQAYPDAKIRNFQYDVESYLQPAYASNPKVTLTQFVSFIDQSATRMQSVDAGFSVVIPHFYDSSVQWTPKIAYQGVTTYTYTQLLNILKKKPQSSLIIMAYRNSFDGADGVSGLTTPELTETSSGGYSTKVIIAQETGNVSPSYVTFFGQSKSDLFSQLNTIYSEFKHFSAFGGTAVDYIDPFLKLH